LKLGQTLFYHAQVQQFGGVFPFGGEFRIQPTLLGGKLLLLLLLEVCLELLTFCLLLAEFDIPVAAESLQSFLEVLLDFGSLLLLVLFEGLLALGIEIQLDLFSIDACVLSKDILALLGQGGHFLIELLQLVL
jgi:hypothetical protein